MNERDPGTEATEQTPHEQEVAEYEETDANDGPGGDGGRPAAGEDLAADKGLDEDDDGDMA
ncbi:MAG: hypothetical protein M3406_16255 [Chloroflexota bacterium]|nr:hypothetical protein [Chloroflexota bacterium]